LQLEERKKVNLTRSQQQDALKQLNLTTDEDGNDLSAERRLQLRLEFLARQAHTFAGGQITTHSGAAGRSSSRAKREPSRHGGRMSEGEEDAKMKDDDGENAGLVRITEQPVLLSHARGKMRDYQLEGLNWMVNLYIKGINGVLADEMGLGKTLQTISLLTFLREAYGIKGKHIVIVPKSTLGNWMREFRNWSPIFRCLKFHGNKDARRVLVKQLAQPDTWDVCVTTFEMCSTEQNALGRVKWSYIVIDEAHRIKNENSLLSKSVRTFVSDARLLLTGTPLQNNLHELWALLNFLLPNIFGSAEEFDQWFKDDDVEGQQSDVVQRLHKILRCVARGGVRACQSCAPAGCGFLFASCCCGCGLLLWLRRLRLRLHLRRRRVCIRVPLLVSPSAACRCRIASPVAPVAETPLAL
jgi:SWI/SNF-related matrix-associated actin-dependent regulator of chromatin subfamily A member 5